MKLKKTIMSMVVVAMMVIPVTSASADPLVINTNLPSAKEPLTQVTIPSRQPSYGLFFLRTLPVAPEKPVSVPPISLMVPPSLSVTLPPSQQQKTIPGAPTIVIGATSGLSPIASTSELGGAAALTIQP